MRCTCGYMDIIIVSSSFASDEGIILVTHIARILITNWFSAV